MKLTEITPKELGCIAGACPKVFETDDGKIVVVGRLLLPQEEGRVPGGVGEGEAAVEVPKGIITGLKLGQTLTHVRRG